MRQFAIQSTGQNYMQKWMCPQYDHIHKLAA